jgi:hypothetical protein
METMIKSWTPRDIDAVLERVLLTVEKPGRYTGGEHNQVVNDWEAASVRVALVFPDIYELGMSNLGLATLYDILNRRAGILCERAYCPWSDMEAGCGDWALYSLETHRHQPAVRAVVQQCPGTCSIGSVPVRTAERDATIRSFWRWPRDLQS